MKILVLSDSHAGLSFMRWCIRAVRPDAVVHLGDYYQDGETMAEENPHIPFYRVPGNCDAHRGFIPDPEVRVEKVCGVWLYMTHGHRHNVKLTLHSLLRDAKASKVQAVLYGHTHRADCFQEDGLWVLNPGTCGVYGGSVGLIEAENGEVVSCRVLEQGDVDALCGL